jgi:hypothetical protein
MFNNWNKYDFSCKINPCDGTEKAGDSSFSHTLISRYLNYKILYLRSEEEEIQVKSEEEDVSSLLH